MYINKITKRIFILNNLNKIYLKKIKFYYININLLGLGLNGYLIGLDIIYISTINFGIYIYIPKNLIIKIKFTIIKNQFNKIILISNNIKSLIIIKNILIKLIKKNNYQEFGIYNNLKINRIKKIINKK